MCKILTTAIFRTCIQHCAKEVIVYSTIVIFFILVYTTFVTEQQLINYNCGVYYNNSAINFMIVLYNIGKINCIFTIVLYIIRTFALRKLK